MNTEDLIRVLSRDAPARAAAPPPLAGLALAVLAGAVASFGVLVAWLGLRDMAAAVHTSAYWMKAGYTALMLAAGLGAAAALSRPGRAARRWLGGPLLLFALLLALGLLQVMQAPEESRAALWLGHTWNVCPWRIVALAAPIYLAVGLAMRRLAPTSLTAAGAAAGLAAGAAAATVYGLACTETAAAFVAVWYTAGIAACTALGALAGRWLLRW